MGDDIIDVGYLITLFDIWWSVIRGATHLNGAEGVVLRDDANHFWERVVVSLDGGAELSVKAANCQRAGA